MKVLICDPVHEDAISYLKDNGIEVTNEPAITPDDLIQKVADFDAIFMRSRTKVTRDVIEAGRNLKFIGRVGTGTDNIDLAEAKKRGITVVNAPGANSQAVAEHTIGLMLALLRHIPHADSSMKEGRWQKKELKGVELHSKTVGIIGYGRIGSKVEGLVVAFGAHIKTHDVQDTDENLTDVLGTSDIITLHTALTPETQNLMDSKRLSLMKKSVYLINTSRAEVIDEDALFEALKSGEIAGAALDVFWKEPLKGEHRWRTLDNVILTPHIAGETHEAARAASMMVVDDLLRYKKGYSVKNIVE